MQSITKPVLCMLALTAMLVVAQAAPALAQQAPKVEGSYQVEGTNPNGNTYKGRAVIQKTTEGYRMTWTIGGQSFSGQGRMQDGSLVINWQGPGGSGLVIYQAGPGGCWRGVWDGPKVRDVSKMRGREILTPLAQQSLKVEGSYQVEGTNPNGTSYKGRAVVQKTPEGYRMTWTIGRSTHSGLGKMKDGRLVIHWQGAGASGLVIYQRDSSGVWQGVWGGPTDTDPAKMRGRETLHPMAQ